MFTLAYAIVMFVYRITRYLPANLLLRFLRARAGLKFAVAGVIVAAPYGFFAYWLGEQVASGVLPKGVIVVVCGCGIGALKLVLYGRESLIRFVRSRIREARSRQYA